MITVIDTNTISLYYDQLTQLDGAEYLLRFIWSFREECFYLNIYDQDENPIALLIRLVIGIPLLRRFQDSRLPLGVLMCVDLSQQGVEIQTPDELGVRVPLVYISADDAALAA